MADNKRGGSRPGSGRKSNGKTYITTSVSMTVEQLAKIKEEAKKRNITVSKYILQELKLDQDI